MNQLEYWVLYRQEIYGGLIISMIFFRLYIGFILINKETSKDAIDSFMPYHFNVNESLYFLMSAFFFFPVKNQKYKFILQILNIILIIQWIMIVFGLYVFVKNSP